MALHVVSGPSKTVLHFPNEPGLEELYEADLNCRHANTRFWSGFVMVAYVLVIGWAAGWGDVDTMRSILFAFGGAMIGRLLDKMRTQHLYQRQRKIWVDAALKDEKWEILP